MKIAIEGCAHGQLEKIYDSILNIQQRDNIKVDLLICCGDFQSTRNYEDLQCMAVPQKYLDMCTFYKYYSGELVAPILTIFIGGNHEASNYLQELAFGGWVAPNIYYLGYAGIVNVAGVRIAGVSGIYKGHDYMRGHFEVPPYGADTKRSVYHIRNIEVFRLKQTKQPIDIFVSHDWPRGIYNHGNANQLLKCKPFFAEEVRTNTLGSKACEELLDTLKPAYWFSAHLHVKFAALVSHESAKEGESRETKFLALDKCLPRRQFLQILDIPHDDTKPLDLQYDLEWLAILFLTNHLTSVKKNIVYLPNQGDNCRWDFSPTASELDLIQRKFHADLTVPLNFSQTVTAYNPAAGRKQRGGRQPDACINPQTMTFCDLLGVDDPMAMALGRSDTSLNTTSLNQTLPSFLTPERPGDLTRVSVMSDTSFREDPEPSPLKRMSLVLPSPRNLDTSDLDDTRPEDEEPITREDTGPRLSLSLPPPLAVEGAEPLSGLRLLVPPPLDIALDGGDGTKIAPEVEVEGCLLSPIPTVDNSVTSSVDGARMPCIGIQKELEENVVGPQVKKFKRRNQALYASTDDE